VSNTPCSVRFHICAWPRRWPDILCKHEVSDNAWTIWWKPGPNTGPD